MDCYLVTRDLMFRSQVEGPLRAAGHDVQGVPDPQPILAGAADGAYFVVLDLTTPGDLHDWLTSLRASSAPPSHVIAIGPHVHHARLQAARDAGCDLVLTKGEASRALGQSLAQLGLGPS